MSKIYKMVDLLMTLYVRYDGRVTEEIQPNDGVEIERYRSA